MGAAARYVQPVRLLAVAVVSLSLPATAAAAVSFPQFGATCHRADFGAAGTTVRAEFCRAEHESGRAVVVLHGCGGFSTFDHRLVTTLPRYGIATLDVDYFGPTPPPGRTGFCGARGAVGTAFPTWIAVADRAAATLRATPGVSARGVGVVGWSLGGGVAIAAAAGSGAGRQFDAVAGFSTGAFDAAAVAGRLPPTILLSGGASDAIPLAETLPLYDALREAHVPSALFVYPHGSHDWPGRQGGEGIARAAAFLRRYLRP
jgi:dienelactone hydrolase